MENVETSWPGIVRQMLTPSVPAWLQRRGQLERQKFQRPQFVANRLFLNRITWDSQRPATNRTHRFATDLLNGRSGAELNQKVLVGPPGFEPGTNGL